MVVLEFLIVLGVIILSMTLHEAAHGYMAYWLGDETAKNEGRLTLNPLKHLDPMMSVVVPVLLYLMGGPVIGGAKPVPVDSRNLKYKEWGMALVALAGPAMNFLLAFLGFAVMVICGAWSGTGAFWVSDGGELLAFALGEFVMVNLGFMVFNLIPITPLDGSRILYAIAPDSVREVMTRIEGTMGIMLIYLVVFLFGTGLSSVTSTVISGILNFFCLVFGVS